MKAKNSVVLNAAFVSVLSRRVRVGARWALSVRRSFLVGLVCALMKSSGLCLLCFLLGLSPACRAATSGCLPRVGERFGPWFRGASAIATATACAPIAAGTFVTRPSTQCDPVVAQATTASATLAAVRRVAGLLTSKCPLGRPARYGQRSQSASPSERA